MADDWESEDNVGSWRVTTTLFLAVAGLLGASTVGAALSTARCGAELDPSPCSVAIMETETPQPSATIHHHLYFAGSVWDNAVGTPLPRAEVGITNCGGSRSEATTDATGHYGNGHPTEGEFSCGMVAYDVSAEGHVTVRQSVRRDSDHRDFVLARLPVSVLFLPHTGVEHAPLR
jgi:hypothetical protein